MKRHTSVFSSIFHQNLSGQWGSNELPFDVSAQLHMSNLPCKHLSPMIYHDIQFRTVPECRGSLSSHLSLLKYINTKVLMHIWGTIRHNRVFLHDIINRYTHFESQQTYLPVKVMSFTVTTFFRPRCDDARNIQWRCKDEVLF